MTEALQSNEYLNREFVKNVSHEFKTPLSIIIGYSELLKSENLTENERTEYLNYIYEEANRLNNLSGKLLAISRIDSGKYILYNDEFELDEQIRSIVLSMQIEWSKKKLTVDVEMQPVRYVSNKELCFIIWQNLISNAIKYTGERGEIKITLEIEKGQVVFDITNSGNLLSGKEDIIFQSFYTGDNAGKEKGTGLGLPLVKKTV